MSVPSDDKAIWKIIKNAKTGMLVTHDGGELRARPMQVVQDEFSNKLWFFTSSRSEKVQESQTNHQVCVTFNDADHDGYLSLSGEAKLVRDAALIEKLWNPMVDAWFPDGKQDPEVALLEIDVDQGEYWLADENKMYKLYELAKAKLKHERPDVGKHRKFVDA